MKKSKCSLKLLNDVIFTKLCALDKMEEAPVQRIKIERRTGAKIDTDVNDEVFDKGNEERRSQVSTGFPSRTSQEPALVHRLIKFFSSINTKLYECFHSQAPRCRYH